MKNTEIIKIVSQKRAWYERLLAAILFSLAVYIILLFYKNHGVSFTDRYLQDSLKVLASLIVLIGFGIRFSVIMSHHFDLKLNRYRAYWSVGPFGKGKWIYTSKLDRVSTFLNSGNECIVSIWDINNNRFKIAVFYKIEDAVSFGRILAEKLSIKFLERN